MKGTWLLLLILLSSALPAIVAFFLLKKRASVTLPWFLASLFAGIVSFIVAAIIQSFFTPAGQSWFIPVFFDIFIRIALVEEASRIIPFIFFLIIIKNLKDFDRNFGNAQGTSFGAALGLAAGLGFALIESAYHGIADLNITLIRLFTAAPLHGACGIRAGAAVFTFSRSKGKALFYFSSAVLIHGAYNLAIVSPTLPSALAILIAITAFLASLTYIKTSRTAIDAF
jgi:RsiW-degrading membrane proteinase PrsW (M82 family)